MNLVTKKELLFSMDKDEYDKRYHQKNEFFQPEKEQVVVEHVAIRNYDEAESLVPVEEGAQQEHQEGVTELVSIEEAETAQDCPKLEEQGDDNSDAEYKEDENKEDKEVDNKKIKTGNNLHHRKRIAAGIKIPERLTLATTKL